MSAPFGQFVKENRGTIKLVFTITGGITTALSYQGVAAAADPTGGLLSAITPAFYALGTGTLVWGHYKLAADIMPQCKSARERMLGGTVMAAGLLGLVALSSPLNLSAMAGPEALDLYMQDSLVPFERTLEESYQRGMRLEGLVAVITAEADRLDRNAKEEAQFGRISNVAGKGSLSRTITDGENQVRGFLKPVNQAIGRVIERAKKGRAILEKSRQVTASDEDTNARMRSFAREMDTLRTTLVEMDVSAVAGSIEQLGLNLPESIVGRTTSSDPRIAAAQDKSLAFILKNFKATGNNIAAAAREITDLPRIEIPEFKRISRIKAALRYAGSFLPLAIGSVMLDCAPALIVMWLMLAGAVGSRSSEVRMRAGKMTLDEMCDALDAVKLLGEQHRGQEFLRGLLNGDGESSAPRRNPRTRQKKGGADDL